MDRLDNILDQHRQIGLDSCIFIYHFEANPAYLPTTTRLLSAISGGQPSAVTSVISLMEITVRPLQLGRADIASEYEILLLNFPHLDVLDVTAAIARRAAELRAMHRLKPADALQVATCLEADATLFITNDRAIRAPLAHMDILQLSDLVSQ